MPLTFVKLSDGELKKKAEYFATSDFSRVHHTPRPDLPISKTWSPIPYFVPSRHEESIEEIDNFQVRPDDVWILGFPKTGTTWTQEMVWQICNNLNFEKGKSIELYERSPFFEQGTIFSFQSNSQAMGIIDTLTTRRIIKSHMPAPLLPKRIWTVKPKIIYITRNIKDVAVSFFHFYQNIFGYKGSFDDFIDAFLGDAVIFTPLESHINDYWNMRNESNILFSTYEEMKKDLQGVIEKTAKFLEKSYTKEQLKTLEDHLSFSKMADNASVNFTEHLDRFGTIINCETTKDFKFMRKGKIGSFREEMTPEQIKRFDEQIKKRHEESKADPELLNIFMGTTY
uniref:Putative sulfotransferase n=1 Tax=Nyssomyia neivai TaxID=330878 RepID=A0A1L8E4U6_9DIPT